MTQPRTAAPTIVDDRAYRTSHNKAPRGYGAWAFATSTDAENVAFITGLYAECKKVAMRHFAGSTVIYTLP